MAGKTAKSLELGQHIVVGGLVVQIVFFGFFVIVAAIYHTRVTKKPTARSTSSLVPWRRHLYTLYAASILILIRSLFRIVEYQQGNDGYLLGHEVFLYSFDAVLMLFVMVLFNVTHPGSIGVLLRQRNDSGNSSELNSVTNIAGRAKAEDA